MNIQQTKQHLFNCNTLLLSLYNDNKEKEKIVNKILKLYDYSIIDYLFTTPVEHAEILEFLLDLRTLNIIEMLKETQTITEKQFNLLVLRYYEVLKVYNFEEV